MKYATNRRVNVRTIKKLNNEEGLTLRNGKIVEYKTGWQVGICGIECSSAEEVSAIIHSEMAKKSNIGIWLSNGIYYVDISKRISTKNKALEVGRANEQLCIYGWRKRKAGQLVYC